MKILSDVTLKDRPVATTPNVQKWTLDADIKISDPGNTGFMSGTFVPKETSVRFRINMTGWSQGGSRGVVTFRCGPGNDVRLHGAGHYAPPAAGVQEVLIGKVGSQNEGAIIRTFDVTGLTPGTTYTWRLMAGIVGAYDNALGVSATNLSGPFGLKIAPNTQFIAISEYLAQRVRIIEYPQRPIYLQAERLYDLDQQFIATSSGPYFVAFSPDSSQLWVGCFGASSIDVFDTDTFAKLGSIALASSPRGIVFLPNGVTAYVACGDGKVYPITVATRAVGAGINLTGPNLRQIAVTPDGTYLFVTDATNKMVKRITVADGTILATGVSGTAYEAVRVNPEGTKVYAGKSDQMDAWDLNLTYVGTIIAEPTGLPTAQCQSIDFGQSGNFVYTAWSDGHWQYNTTFEDRLGNPPMGNRFDGVDVGSQAVAIAISKDAQDILLIDYTDNKLHYWPGGNFYISAGAQDNYYGAFAEVIVEGVQ